MQLFNKVVNEWEEVTYVPTTLGNALLAVAIAALLIVAVVCIKKSADSDKNWKTNKKGKLVLSTKQLAFCAMAIALATVLSNIKVFRFPTGGSITLLSMLVISLPGFFFGLVPGILSGLAYGVLQMIIDPYILTPVQALVDYLLSFGALGLSGIFVNSKKAALMKGYIAGVLGRYVFAVISGWVFFGAYAWDGWAALPYSLVYNAIYIFAEAAVTIVILLIPGTALAIKKIKNMANQ